MFFEARGHVGIMVGTGSTFGNEELMRKAKLGGSRKTWRIGDVRDDDSNLGVETAFADGLRDREEIRTSTGEQDAEAAPGS